ncbi:hypothetical protein ACIOC1_07780 [Streptomyces sp. NPDC088197]|uniref:hypothetical protein n=1 Tax=Streptomyces sp. NPDC088197 TaxID=3365840 RepID=UPI00381D2F7E
MAVITMYGPMECRDTERSPLALLDLLRAYTHDCLHYGSRRRYVEVAGRPVRTQYGINYRRATGQPYSVVDRHGSRNTRNLGIVMEGACDKEARSITRQTAERFGVAEPFDILDALVFRDVTGTLSEEDTGRAVEVHASEEQTRYAAALSDYDRTVTRRYVRFLAEFGLGEGDELHARLLAAIVTGDVTELMTWLDERHGPGTFTGLFSAPGYFEPDPSA